MLKNEENFGNSICKKYERICEYEEINIKLFNNEVMIHHYLGTLLLFL